MAARDPPAQPNVLRGKPPTSAGDTTAAAPAPTGDIINDGSVGKENGFKSGGLQIQVSRGESLEDFGEAQMPPGTGRHGAILDERNRNGLHGDADMDESHADILLSEDDAGMHAGDVIDLSEDAGVSSSDGALDGSDAAEGGADDLEALLRRAGAVMEQHAQEVDRRSSRHLARAPDALRCLKDALVFLQGQEKGKDKELLLSVHHQCEQAVLAVTDDCIDINEGNSRETLSLAKALVEEMLGHRLLKEVLTAACRDRLQCHLRQIDEIVQSLFGPPGASQGNSASQGLGGVHDSQRSGDVCRIELKPVEWGQEDRKAMLRFCDQYYLPMLPLASDVERVEMVRQMVEYSLRSRFKEAKVMVFGSSAGQLATPGSDIDLTLCLPTRARLIQELKDKVRDRERAITAAEENFPETVRLLEERTTREKKLRRLESNLRGIQSDLASRSRTRAQKEKLLERAEARVEKIKKQETVAKDAPPALTPRANGDTPSEETPSPNTPNPSSSPETCPVGAEKDTRTNGEAKRESAVSRAGDGEGIGVAATVRAKGQSTKKGKDIVEDFSEGKIREMRAKYERGRLVMERGRVRQEKAEEALRAERKAFAEWTEEHFRRAPPGQRREIDILMSCQASLGKASRTLKATGEIVFQIKRVLVNSGFTNVMAVARSRVPVVKTRAPRNLWRFRDSPLGVDISVNNLVALHNTRLLLTYTNLDSRIRQLLYLVKAWATMRGVNDSSKGTLSSYGHCVAALHYLLRIGLVPCLLKEHKSMASEPDPSDPPPLVVDGIDVSFRIREAGLSAAHPLSTGTPNGNGHARTVRQRTSGVDNVTTGGTEESSPRPKSAGVNNLGETQKVGVPLRADQAEICDLLAGYFRYFAEDFRHITQVMTIRPKSILNKRDVWKKPKLWRTSIEDPFETFDSINPHDLGSVISRSGQALLNQEWNRGHALMQRGGALALRELLMPCAAAVKLNPKYGLGQGQDHGQGQGGGGHGGQRRGRDQPRGAGRRLKNGGGRIPEQNRQLWIQGQERASPAMTHATPHGNGGMPVQVHLSPGNMGTAPGASSLVSVQRQPSPDTSLTGGGSGGVAMPARAPSPPGHSPREVEYSLEGARRQGSPQQGAHPQSVPPQGVPQQGDPKQGDPPQGVPQQGVSQKGVSRQSVPGRGGPHQGVPQGVFQQNVPRQGVSNQGVSHQDASQQGVSRQSVPQGGPQQGLQGVPQHGVQRQSVPPQGVYQQGVSQTGVSRQGVSGQGGPQQGVSQQSVSQQSISQQGVSHQGDSQQSISRQSVPRQGGPRQALPQQDFSQRSVSQQGITWQSVPRQVGPQHGAPHQSVPPKGVPRQGAPRKVGPQQGVSHKGVSQKSASRQSVPRQGGPQQGVSQQSVYQQGIPRQSLPRQVGSQHGVPHHSVSYQGVSQQGVPRQFYPQQSVPRQGAFQQVGPHQGVSHQGVSQQDVSRQNVSRQVAPQRGVPQGVSQQDILRQNFPQQGVPQHGVPHQGVSHHSFSQEGVSYHNFSQQGVPRQGVPRQVVSQQGFPQQEFSRQVFPHQGVSQQVGPQQGVPQQGVSQQASPHYGAPRQDVSRQSVPEGKPHQGVVLQNVSRQGVPQHGVAQQGFSRQSVPHQSVPRQGVQPQNVPQQSVSQRGVPQHGVTEQGRGEGRGSHDGRGRGRRGGRGSRGWRRSRSRGGDS